MFNNFINSEDFHSAAEMIRGGRIKSLVSKLFSTKQKRIERAWQQGQRLPTDWWNIQEVRDHWNYLISGDAKIDYCEYIAHKYFSGTKALNALSLGCGSGYRELKWAQSGKFENIDAYDLLNSNVEYGRAEACKAGYGEIIKYHTENVYDIKMRQSYYDIVFAEHSLHHLSPLKQILFKINDFLKENGFFIINEFVGPTRFQWTDKQLEEANKLLSVLPARYRVLWESKSVKSRIFRPSKLRVFLRDPTEAAESSLIMPLLYDIFDVIEVKEYGGTILHLLFNGIAHNFLSRDKETQALLRLCIGTENSLIKNKTVQSDFAILICKKRNQKTPSQP